MGTSASRSSPSPPTSCSLVERVFTTRLFTVPNYSRCARMPAGTALKFDTLILLGSGYHLKLYPAGLDRDSADCVALFVIGPFHNHYSDAAPASVSLEILDASGRHTVFDEHTARSELTLRDHRHKRSKGYVRFVNRREMEASGCVREDDDSLTIRCTISVDRHVTRPLMLAPPPHGEVTAGAVTAVEFRTVTIGGFSRLRAALQTGECAYTPHFALGGSSWYLKVYPNGHCDDSKDCVAVFLGRGKSDRPATKAKFRFDLPVDDLAEEEARKEVEFTTHTFDCDAPVHASPYLVTSSDLASAEQMVTDDCFIVRCHLRVIKVTTPRLMLPVAAAPTVTAPAPAPPCEVFYGIGKTPTSPAGVVAETEDEQASDSDQTPLLADLHQR